MRRFLSLANYWLQVLVRCFLAMVFIGYGLAKLAGTQFITEGAVLDLPVRQLTGFEFTWIYFGYSPLYSYTIALAQIGAASLLLFGRTRRLGSVLLLTIVGNIVLVNFGYNISHDTKVVSVLYLALTLYLVLCDFPAYWRCFWQEPAVQPAAPRFIQQRPWLSFSASLLLLGAMLGIEAWGIQALREQFMASTPLTGDYWVEPKAGTLPAELEGWKKLSLERGLYFQAATASRILYGDYEFAADTNQVTLEFIKQEKPEPRDVDRRLEQLVAARREAAEITSIADAEAQMVKQKELPRWKFQGTARLLPGGNWELQGNLEGKPLNINLRRREWLRE